jgi:2-polyprenyl-3-methyl-5-hydroxy-6-metoxy-1,4-benzoquinol methylase
MNKHDVGTIIKKAWGEQNPAGWFDTVYAKAAAGYGDVPWASMRPHPDLTEWLTENKIDGTGKKAIVIGAGLGDDAEELSSCGFAVTAFDISQAAIEWCQQRFPGSHVNYLVADLLDIPHKWRNAFDLVLEIHTLQALPHQLTEQTMTNIAAMAVPGGTVLVMCFAREPQENKKGIPWPLSRMELDDFHKQGLIEISFEDHLINSVRRFCVQYNKVTKEISDED